ncbi:MAG: flavin-containing monooxygenase [Granulosicoccus sp.]
MASPDVLIVGTGFAGIYLLHKLRKADVTTMAVDAAPDLGGTWYLNRYPGCRCDVESLEYSFSFSEDLRNGWDWSERYAAQPEILRYANWVADTLDVRRNMVFDTRIANADWDEAQARWMVESDDGKRWTPRHVILATGALTVPKMPEIPGLETFKGKVLHTAKWPHEPVDLDGKHVGVIGTGSSGIQVSTALASMAGHLNVFQRTPSYSVEAKNTPLTDADRAAFRDNFPNLNKWAMGSKSGLLTGPAIGETMEFSPERQQKLLWEAWTKGGAFHLTSVFTDTRKDEASNKVLADFVKARIREKIKDTKIADLMCPDDFIATRRICVDTGYYEIFNQDNVSLVDTKADGIVAVTATGLQLASGTHHGLDVLVLATGYDAMTGAITKIDLRGQNGVRIQDVWENGPQTMMGLAMAGFPNLFTVTGPGSPSALTNLIRSIEHHGDWITNAITHMRNEGIAAMAPTPQAQSNWTAHVAEVAAQTLFTRTKSWYMGTNIPGKPQVFMAYAGGLPAYRDHCDTEATRGYPGFEKIATDTPPAKHETANDHAAP